MDSDTFQLLFILIVIIAFEEMFLYYRFYKYTKKKYPKINKILKQNMFREYFSSSFYKEIIHNSHKNDRVYSFFINVQRINLLLGIFIFLLVAFSWLFQSISF